MMTILLVDYSPSPNYIQGKGGVILKYLLFVFVDRDYISDLKPFCLFPCTVVRIILTYHSYIIVQGTQCGAQVRQS